jgi:hypothetical protein
MFRMVTLPLTLGCGAQRSIPYVRIAGNIEAGTELGNGTLHVAMTFDYGVGIDEEEVPHHLLHLLLLGVSAGVGGGAVGTQATFVADADAVVVVGAAVGADFTQLPVL